MRWSPWQNFLPPEVWILYLEKSKRVLSGPCLQGDLQEICRNVSPFFFFLYALVSSSVRHLWTHVCMDAAVLPPILDPSWTRVTVPSILDNVFWDLFDTLISSLAPLETSLPIYPRVKLFLAWTAGRHLGQISWHLALAVWKWTSCPERDGFVPSSAHLSLWVRGRGRTSPNPASSSLCIWS